MNPEPPSDQVRRSFQLSGPVDRFVTPTCQKARQVYTMQRRKRVGGVGRIGLVGGGEHVTVSKKVPAGNADLQVPVAPTLLEPGIVQIAYLIRRVSRRLEMTKLDGLCGPLRQIKNSFIAV